MVQHSTHTGLASTVRNLNVLMGACSSSTNHGRSVCIPSMACQSNSWRLLLSQNTPQGCASLKGMHNPASSIFSAYEADVHFIAAATIGTAFSSNANILWILCAAFIVSIFSSYAELGM